MSEVSAVLQGLKEEFVSLHRDKEDWFWKAKMDLVEDATAAHQALSKAEVAANRFLQDPERLKSLRALENKVASPEEAEILQGWIETFAANTLESEEARALSEEIVGLENELESKRRSMNLGYTDPDTGAFVQASSVKLTLLARNDEREEVRKAAFQGLRSIEDFVLAQDFLTIVRKRNELGRSQGYEDYYDWRVSMVERMRKREIFAMLDELAERTAAKAKENLDAFVAKHGESARKPWNFPFLRSGTLAQRFDPYFSFGESMRRWIRSFAALQVRFRDATLTLDLVDRKGKYENGFMHGPEICFFDEGNWHPARINFTANAVPGQTGSGRSAIRTLFHEGGHAAHFSNITQAAPCFAHEFAPTSVAYAETQSMFLDSLLKDADWMTRYAANAEGETVPMSLIEEGIREQQPFRGWDIRTWLTISMGERALYELSEDELRPERVLSMFRDVEMELTGLDEGGIRPILSVPHLLSGGASAYYHGYILAEMAVYQTRNFFLERDGYLTDNPAIGPDLAEHYWAPGNKVPFQDTIRSLTGQGLRTDALVADCNKSVEQALAEARQAVEGAASRALFQEKPELGAVIHVDHGTTRVASSEKGGFDQLCDDFSTWVSSLEAEA